MEQQPRPNESQKPDLDYRQDDISTAKLVIYIGSGFIIFTILLILLVWAFSGKSDVIKGTDTGKEISNQRIALNSREDSILTTYALIDTINLIYRMPVDSAMHLLVNESAELSADPIKKIRNGR